MEIPGYRHISLIGELATNKILRFKNHEERPLITSSEKLNKKIGGFLFGEQWTIVAPSGAGKTAFGIWLIEELINISLNPVYQGKVIVLVDTFEMPSVNLYLRSIASKTNLTTHQLLSYSERLTEDHLSLISRIQQTLSHLPVYYRQNSQTVREWVENKKKIQALNTDKYIINLFDHARLITRKSESSEMELLTNLVTEGMWLKNDFQMLNIFLSQVNGNIETSVDRKELGKHLLTKTDIFGSSGIYQTSDGVLTLQRPGMYDLKEWRGINTGLSKDLAGDDTLLIVNSLKNREGDIGPIAMRHNIKNYQFFDELPNVDQISGNKEKEKSKLNVNKIHVNFDDVIEDD